MEQTLLLIRAILLGTVRRPALRPGRLCRRTLCRIHDYQLGCGLFAFLDPSSIPEIQDLNVLSRIRRPSIGTHLMNEAERAVLERSSVVGNGVVGMSPDYGAVHRFYALRGYVPD